MTPEAPITLTGPVERPASRLAYPLKTLAQAIGCDLSTLYRAAKRGDLTIRKHGRSSIVLVSDAMAYLQSLPVGVSQDGTSAATEARHQG
jgi:hypothetical protein